MWRLVLEDFSKGGTLMDSLNRCLDTINHKLEDIDFIRAHAASSKDFTRKRVFTFKNTWWGMICHGGSSLKSEVPLMATKFPVDIPLASPQAFSKARNKIIFTACKELFNITVKYLTYHKMTYKGYKLAAVDGSKIITPETNDIRTSLGTCGNHLSDRAGGLISILYDPLTDIVLNGSLCHINTSERTVLFDMLEETPLNDTIILLDRGYPGKETYRFLNEKGLKYIIRSQIGVSNPRYIREAQLEDQIVTDIYKNPDITQRVLRIKLNDGKEELLLTNIMDPSFTIEDFKTLYHMRWPIETKYDEIKNKLHLEKFTGMSLNSVYQDFYNALIKANIVAYLRLIASKELNDTNKKVSIQSSIKYCLVYLPSLLKNRTSRFKTIEAICNTLKRMLIPIRPNRSYARNKKTYKQKYRLNLK